MPSTLLTDTAASHQAMEEAAEWFVRLRSHASARDREGWQAWLDASADHHHAWRYVESVSQRFLALQSTEQAPSAVAAIRTVQQRRTSRRQVLRGLTLSAGTGALGWLAWRHTLVHDLVLAWAAEHRTSTGEVRQLTLQDGTRIWLGTASALDTHYSPALRQLRLHAGEVLIETAPDHRPEPSSAHAGARPFVIDTAHGRLRALGTRFSVRLGDDATQVSVFQGAVEIRTASGPTHVLTAGRQTRFNAKAISPETAADPARESWSRDVLLASDLTLGELVAELARYQHGHIGVSPEVAGLRVLGGYPLRDIDKTLAMLATVLPIKISRPLPWWTRIEALPPS